MTRTPLLALALAAVAILTPSTAWAQQSDTSTVGISPSPSPPPSSDNPGSHCRPEDGALERVNTFGPNPDAKPNAVAGGSLYVKGVPGTRFSVSAYTRPGTAHYTLGSFVIDEDGYKDIRVHPKGNTRYFVNHVYPDCPGHMTTVMLVEAVVGGTHARRIAPRVYGFNGIYHGPDGKVLNLYRATRSRDGVIGAPILTAQTRTRGEFWSFSRTFLGSGEFLFWASVGDDINSLRDHGLPRFTVVH
jgi:hypothetical protein